VKLFNFNSKKKPAKPGAKKTTKAQPKKRFILSRKQRVIAIVGGVLVLGGAGYWAYASYTMDEVSAGGCVSNIYKKGAVKTCVKYAQQMLGMSNADSSFGTDTYNKVKAFQSKYDLTVDGTIGPKTWDKLCTKGVNATAKKNAGCDGTSATGWTNLGGLQIDKWHPDANKTAGISGTAYVCKVASGSSWKIKTRFVTDSTKNDLSKGQLVKLDQFIKTFSENNNVNYLNYADIPLYAAYGKTVTTELSQNAVKGTTAIHVKLTSRTIGAVEEKSTKQIAVKSILTCK